MWLLMSYIFIIDYKSNEKAKTSSDKFCLCSKLVMYYSPVPLLAILLQKKYLLKVY